MPYSAHASTHNTSVPDNSVASSFWARYSWAQYLSFLALIIGAGFFSSGVVTWLAANWAGFSKFQKLYGTQAVFVLSLLLSMWLYWYQKQRLKSSDFALPSAVFVFVGGVLVGAIFALIGQTYQTGADAWQLFALWSVLQLPLLIALPNIASYALLMLTTHVTMFLYVLQQDSWFMETPAWNLLPMAGSLILLAISEVFNRQLHDTQWRILPKLAVLGLGICVVYSSLMSQINTTFSLVAIVIGALGIALYRYKRFDLTIYVLSLLIIIYSVVSLLLRVSSFAGGSLFSIALIVLIAGIVGVIFGIRIWRQHIHNLSQSGTHVNQIPWVLQAFFLLVIMLVTLLILGVLVLSMGLERLLIVGLILLAAGLLMMHRQRLSSLLNKSRTAKQAQNQSQDQGQAQAYHPSASVRSELEPSDEFSVGTVSFDLSAQAFAALGLIMVFIDTVFLSDMYYGRYYYTQEPTLSPRIFVFIATAIAVFFLVKAAWLRLLAVVLLSWIIFNFVLPTYVIPSFIEQPQPGAIDAMSSAYAQSMYFIINLWILLIPVSLWLAYRYPEVGQRRRTLFWAITLYILGSFILSVTSFAMLFDMGAGAPFALSGGQGLIELLLGPLASPIKWQFIPYYLVFISPTIVAFFMGHSLSIGGRLLSTLVVFVLTLLWANNIAVLFALALLLMAYHMRSLVLFGLALMAGIGFLAIHYFSLHVPLLHKSYGLLISGLTLLLLLGFIYWRGQLRNKIEPPIVNSSESLQGSKLPAVPLGLMGLSLLLVLGLANYKVLEYENVLKQGESLILELAPVDPRSLMQGDYMELRFGLSDDISAQLSRSSHSTTEQSAPLSNLANGYALLRKDAQGVAHFCRLSETIPTDFADCTPGLMMPYKTTYDWPYVHLPTQQFFFAEGAEPYFAQARYGEFKVAPNGEALLVGLRDAQLQPMQAPADMQKWLEEHPGGVEPWWRDTSPESNVESDPASDPESDPASAEQVTAEQAAQQAVDEAAQQAIEQAQQSHTTSIIDVAPNVDTPAPPAQGTLEVPAPLAPSMTPNADTPAPPALPNVPSAQ